MRNCTHFRHPTDEQLQNSDTFRSRIYFKSVPFELYGSPSSGSPRAARISFLFSMLFFHFIQKRKAGSFEGKTLTYLLITDTFTLVCLCSFSFIPRVKPSLNHVIRRLFAWVFSHTDTRSTLGHVATLKFESMDEIPKYDDSPTLPRGGGGALPNRSDENACFIF